MCTVSLASLILILHLHLMVVSTGVEKMGAQHSAGKSAARTGARAALAFAVLA